MEHHDGSVKGVVSGPIADIVGEAMVVVAADVWCGKAESWDRERLSHSFVSGTTIAL